MVRKKRIRRGCHKENVYITIGKKDVKNLKVSIKYNGPIKAPIKKG